MDVNESSVVGFVEISETLVLINSNLFVRSTQENLYGNQERGHSMNGQIKADC